MDFITGYALGRKNRQYINDKTDLLEQINALRTFEKIKITEDIIIEIKEPLVFSTYWKSDFWYGEEQKEEDSVSILYKYWSLERQFFPAYTINKKIAFIGNSFGREYDNQYKYSIDDITMLNGNYILQEKYTLKSLNLASYHIYPQHSETLHNFPSIGINHNFTETYQRIYSKPEKNEYQFREIAGFGDVNGNTLYTVTGMTDEEVGYLLKDYWLAIK